MEGRRKLFLGREDGQESVKPGQLRKDERTSAEASYHVGCTNPEFIELLRMSVMPRISCIEAL